MVLQETMDFQAGIDNDIAICDSLIQSPSDHDPSEYIDCIINYTGRYGRFDNDPNFVFNLSNKISKNPKESDYYVITIKQIRSKLQGLRPIAKSLIQQSSDISILNNNSSNSFSSADVSVCLDIDNVIDAVSSLPGLPDSDLENIKTTISEIQDIIDSELSKRDKWASLKSHLPNILDKGLEVSAIIFKWLFRCLS